MKKGNWRAQMRNRKYNIFKNRGEKPMNHRLILSIALSLLVVLLAACGSTGNKSDVIQCTGTMTFVSAPSHYGWNDGGSFSVGALYSMNLESDCPELNGLMKVTENTSSEASGAGYNFSNWGIFRIETAYDGGGVFEGTYHGITKNSVYNNEQTSYNATGSLKGLQLTFHTVNLPVGVTSGKFEATIQNPPQE